MAVKKLKTKVSRIPGTANTARSVVVSDGQKRRNQERVLYQRRCRELDSATCQLREFEDLDVPEFRLWLETEFGALMKKIQDAAAVVTDLNHLIDTVIYFAQVKGFSKRDAYVAVAAARKNDCEAALWDEDTSESRNSPDDDSEEQDGDEFDKMFADFFEHVTGEPLNRGSSDRAARDESFTGSHAREQSRIRTRIQGQDRTSQEYLKTIYRQLVRLLHPDAGTGQNAEQQELWHQVQTAYSWRDIQRLESILKTLTGTGSMIVDLKLIPISHIMDLRRDVEKRMRIVKGKLSVARKSLSWEFRKLKLNKRQFTKLKNEMNYELESDLRDVNSELARQNRQIAIWEKPPPAKKSSGGAKKKTQSGRRPQRQAPRKDRFHESWIFDE